MRVLFSLFFSLIVFSASAKDVFIDVLSAYKAKKIQLEFPKGTYAVNLDDQDILRIKSTDVLMIYSIGNKVSLFKNAQLIGAFKQIYFSTNDSDAHIKVQILSPKQKIFFYQDQLFLRSLSARLQLVNEVELNKYIKGVIESEIGNVKNAELLKVQAVISRTYALKHLDRHKVEGAQLCDMVHCQVYHGKNRFNKEISAAVDSTHYEVIIDQDSNLIEAVFHANCGGLTVHSEDIWSKPRTYLKSVIDTFCITEKQANWTKEIDKQKWVNYLSAKTKETQVPFAFVSENRLNFLPSCTVSTKDLRETFNLRSTYFSVEETDDKVILRGKGFGHGVGMCQEGAIRMANLGKHYHEIIHFYYCDVSIVNNN
jgi:stage II sporulation protein D